MGLRFFVPEDNEYTLAVDQGVITVNGETVAQGAPAQVVLRLDPVDVVMYTGTLSVGKASVSTGVPETGLNL